MMLEDAGEVFGPLFLDTFTGADSTPLIGRMLNFGGVVWEVLKAGDTPVYRIISNRCQKVGSGNYGITYAPMVIPSGVANCKITCDLHYDNTNPCAIVFRCGTGENPTYRIAVIYSNKLAFNRWNGAAYGTETNVAFAMTTGQIYTVSVEMNGTSITGRVGDKSVTFTDSLDSANTRHGIARYKSMNAVSHDNFKIEAI